MQPSEGTKLRIDRDCFLWKTGIGVLTLSLVTFVAGSSASAQATPPEATTGQTPKAAMVPLTPTRVAAAGDPMRTDWANLARFSKENAALPEPLTTEKRVVFLGDSITQNWLTNGLPPNTAGAEFFPGKPYVNRGISGQTSPQMLLRFRQDVIDLKPAAVVILAGTNDVAGNTGDMPPQQTTENLQSMADLAHFNGIRVVLCSILPAYDFPWKPGRQPAPKIIALNSWIKAYATKHGYAYVDFYSAMADERGGLPSKLSSDGVHPSKTGYDIMNPLVEAGIEQALSGR